MPDPTVVPPDWPSLTGLAAVIAAGGGIVAAVTKTVLDFLGSRADRADQAHFRADLLGQVRSLSGQVGTYEDQMEAMGQQIATLGMKNTALEREIREANQARSDLDRTVTSLTRRVRQLEHRNTLYAQTLTAHGIPIPIDGDGGEDGD